MLDEYVIEILKQVKLSKEEIKTFDDVYQIFERLKMGIENNEINGQFIGMCFFEFISKEEIRDSNMAAENFEKILGNILGGNVLGEKNRAPAMLPKDIINLFKNCSEVQRIQAYSDLEENKKRKTDIVCGSLLLSVKSLKGELFDETLKRVNKNRRYELNIGSFSYYALLVGLLEDDKIKNLGERKGGLGSKTAMIKTIYQPLKDNNKWEEFIERFETIGRFIFGDIDFIIGIKSGYKMKLIFIHGEDLVNKLVEILKIDHEKFWGILNRWEGGNPRILYTPLFEELRDSGMIREVELKFDKIIDNEKIKAWKKSLKESIENPDFLYV